MKNFIAVILAIFVISISAQDFGQWQNYTNMKEVTSIASFGQEIWVASPGGAYKYDNNEITLKLTKSEGLTSQIITAVDIDETGNIWFGTNNGIINIYDPSDGSIKKIFDINRNDNTLKSINDIIIRNDIAYISIDFGISLIDINTFEFIESVLKFGNLPSATRVNSIYLEDVLYICNENGLAVQKLNTTNLANPDSWTTYILNSGTSAIPADEVNTAILFENRLIIGTNNGLLQLNGDVWQKYLTTTSNVLKLEKLNESLIILTENELLRFDGTNETLLTSREGPYLFTDLAIEESQILVGTQNGFISASNNNLIIPEGPETNNFVSITIDNNGALWAGTGKNGFGEGFMKFHSNSWTNFNRQNFPELTTDDFHRIFSVNEKVYACSWGFGFAEINEDQITTFDANNTQMDGIPGSPEFIVVMDVKPDQSGNGYWVFNHAPDDNFALSFFDLNSEETRFRFPFINLTTDDYVDLAEVDDNNTKWFSVNRNGLFYFNENGTLQNTSDDTWGRMNSSEYFDGRNITALSVDNRNELWVGTSLGVRIIPDPSRPKSQVLSSFPLRQQPINCIATDALNRKWVGTSQGLFYVSPDGSTLIDQYDSKNSPLPSDDILSIAIDDATGIIYIGTSQGLSTLQTSAVKPNEDFSSLRAYPNPYKIGQNTSPLLIDGLIQQSTIKILSVSGKLIKEFESVGGRIDNWDGRDENGKLVASGIYLIVAYDEDADKVQAAKVAVIRE
jgi:ligand-binding sensor domain-containing protein